METAIGLVAGTLTGFAWLPQIVRIHRTKRADDLAWGYLITIGSGVALWVIYGAMARSMPVILSNGISIALFGWVITKKLRLSEARRIALEAASCDTRSQDSQTMSQRGAT